MVNRPNLFSYATSELSQDAVLCWWLAWASPEFALKDEALHRLGREFLQLLVSRAGIEIPEQITSLTVDRQRHSIDILCLVNESYALIIEDKAGAREHGDQLTRYRRVLEKKEGLGTERIGGVYVQTGDQSDYSGVVEADYGIVHRRDLLRLLGSPDGRKAVDRSDILGDFYEHLAGIDEAVRSFESAPLDKWDADAWKGFFAYLQRTLGAGGWGYVANQSGGFQGFFWSWEDDAQSEQYLQLEEATLCFKIGVLDPTMSSRERAELRNAWSQRFIAAAEREGISVQRPSRFGNGQTMTTAVLGHDYRGHHQGGTLDLDETVSTIRRAERVQQAACQANAERS